MELGDRPDAEGCSNHSDSDDDELCRLRCASEQMEIVAEREKRLQLRRRCKDYPGFAFGRSIFSSDTMMKFSLIQNEVHNILHTQLKRVSLYIFESEKLSKVNFANSYLGYFLVHL